MEVDGEHRLCISFVFDDTATPEINTLSLPDALPIDQLRVPTNGRPRAVGEYLASMTDRYCDQQFREITESSD